MRSVALSVLVLAATGALAQSEETKPKFTVGIVLRFRSARFLTVLRPLAY